MCEPVNDFMYFCIFCIFILLCFFFFIGLCDEDIREEIFNSKPVKWFVKMCKRFWNQFWI